MRWPKYIGIALAGALVAMASIANAQVSTNYWFQSGTTLRPVTSSLSLTIPELGGNGTGCASLDNNGKFGFTSCSSGGSTFPFTPTSYGNSTSTVIGFLAGLFSNGSTTISSIGSGLVGANNGLLYGISSTSLNASITGSAGSVANSLSNDGATLAGSSFNGSVAVSNWAINLNNSNQWTASTTFTKVVNEQNASTTLFTVNGTEWNIPLATAAGAFLAVDNNGKVIATTTPSGSNSAFSPAANYATVAGLPTYTYAGGVITETGNGALSVDGNNPTVGQIVLIKNESGACLAGSGACNNGLYNVTAAGSGIAAFVLTRNSNYNSSSNVIPGIVTYVISGATLADDFWAMTSAAPITVGSTALNYTEVSGGGASVTSVVNSDSTLTISPTTGSVIASLNLAHTNTWSVLQNFAALTATNATTTSLATGSTTIATLSGAGLASCSGATNAVTYTLATGLFGCNSITGSSFAYPFTPATNFNIPVSETTTPLYDTLGIFASSTTGVASWIDQLNIGSTTSGTLATSTDFGNLRVVGNASTTNLFVLTTASTTNLNISSIHSALVLTGATGATSAYGGSACTANQFLTTISALGACGSSAVTGAFFGNVAANTVFANGTGASANPTFLATSSLFTIGTGITQNSNTLGLTIPVVVSSGGTNSTSFANNTLMFYNGTSIIATSSSPLYVTTLFATSSIATSTFLGRMTIGTTTNAGIGISSLIASSTIYSYESNEATSTTQTINFSDSNQSLVYINTSGITFTFTNLTPGETKRIIVCNPQGGTPGTLTWPNGGTLIWAGLTVPTATATNNACDVYSFITTLGTSSPTGGGGTVKAWGTATQNF